MRSCKFSPLKLGTITVLIGFLGTPSAALAQSANSAAAQGLFDEAKALMTAGNAREACPKFEASQRLDPGSGTLVNLAKCYEDTRRIASAWSTYLEAAAAAKASGNSERESGARAQAAALAPRVSKLVIKVDTAVRVDGLEVLRDGTSVAAAEWGVAIPSDEGEHTIVARAPGHREWKSIGVVSGEGTTAEIAVPKLEKVEEPQAVPPPGDAPTSEEPRSSGLGTQKIIALAAGGVGVVGIGIGTVFGLKAMSKKSDAEASCVGSACTDAAGAEAGNDAHAAGNMATIGMVVGAVGLAGGLALWFTAPKEGPATQVSLGLGSVQVRGVW